jgi:sterol desaturase/sphingolipid hydroxylase (fatty acid hydroxylase superfamily)
MSIFTVFTHANLRLPAWLDKGIGIIMISPNMHKVHHHWQQPFTDSNYGAAFSIWDRLLGTYKYRHPSQIKYGIDKYFDAEKDENFKELIKSPFAKFLSEPPVQHIEKPVPENFISQ